MIRRNSYVKFTRIFFLLGRSLCYLNGMRINLNFEYFYVMRCGWMNARSNLNNFLMKLRMFLGIVRIYLNFVAF